MSGGQNQKQKKKVLYTIQGKQFYSLDGIPLQDLKNHAEWIHPDLRASRNLSPEDIDWMDAIAREREFQRICDKATSFKPLTEREVKILYGF